MNDLLRVLTLFGVIAGISSAIASGVVSIVWVLGPLDRAAKNRRAPIQFGLADMLCLFVLIQLPIGGIHWLVRGHYDPQDAIVPDIIVALVATGVWWVCWRTMSRAGILVAWQRMLVLAILLPGGYVGSIALAVLPIAACALFCNGEPTTAWVLVTIELILPVILYIFGRITRLIVASTKIEVPLDAIVLPRDPK